MIIATQIGISESPWIYVQKRMHGIFPLMNIYIYIIYIIFVDCNQLQLVSKLTSCASPWLLPGDHWDDIRDDQIR